MTVLNCSYNCLEAYDMAKLKHTSTGNDTLKACMTKGSVLHASTPLVSKS